MGEVDVFLHLAWEDVCRRCVNLQLQLHELLVDLVIIYRRRKIRKTRPLRYRLASFRKFADLLSVVIFFDMLSGSGNRNRIQYFKEIKVQRFKETVHSTSLHWQFAPGIKSSLCLTKYFID